ncbi:hypothetical protein [Helicobacter cetorum]|uniref:Uncharacterized protein n=1 Tax=Helicobacter cetorum (strain ATCC BAA-540 / CCUG 52418 / MIT 99-5656) TaxID=1163745 RepID=I0EUB6_HELCM|nr:hypothetical protein [Helicobacter cetorum]AFI06535.1 hypothetical protein HCD_07740 [Helicobacter cetorum MIT 99-5656]
MAVSSINQFDSNLYGLLNSKNTPTKESSGSNAPVQNVEAVEKEKRDALIENLPFNPNKRETYGFLVLELMSDREYNAFLRATAGMDESQKRLAAQSLYSLTDFYNGKFSKEVENAPKQPVNGLHKKALQTFNATNNNAFLQRYQNAYNNSSSMDVVL